ncbi:MAG: alpha/beta hydrolase [Cytophagales bacterium]|nr:alpha/beta hydrolase [Cytophagales bacterium]
MSVEKHIDVTLKTSYRTLNSLKSTTRKIWIVFHGQGQLTEFFLKKFEVLDPNEHFIIAPQGLSKYYLNGFTGRVGASWMTKEDRLTEIENQARYVDAVVEAELGDHSAEIVLLGFSQGTATMMRYAKHAQLTFNKMIVWAGTIPLELTPEMVVHWSDLQAHFVYGDEDQFDSNGQFDQEHQKFEALIGRPANKLVFHGKHEVKAEILGDFNL